MLEFGVNRAWLDDSVRAFTRPLVMELGKQPDSTRRHRRCQFMDELSNALSIRLDSAIFLGEFEAALKGQSVGQQVAYSHFMDAFMDVNGQSATLDYPEGWTESDAQRASELIFDYLGAMSVIEVVNMVTADVMEASLAGLQEGWTHLSEREEESRKASTAPLHELEQAELAGLVHSLTSQIESVIFRDPRVLIDHLGESRSETKDMLDLCPTFWCKYKLLAALRSNRKKVQVNDLWDVQHIASVAHYVDCLACDRGMRHLCVNVVGIDQRYGTQIVSSKKDLIRWLQELR